MTNFNELIPEMKDWNGGNGINVESWVGCSGNFKLAIGYSTIFRPEFVEFERYVLRAGFSVESLRGFEQSREGNRQSAEVIMNHLHIQDIQHQGCEDLTRERVVYLGRVLRDIYRAKLAWQFPAKRFEVYFHEAKCENLVEYEISFFQIDG